jgi:hypothetical protein
MAECFILKYGEVLGCSAVYQATIIRLTDAFSRIMVSKWILGSSVGEASTLQA